LGFTAGSGPPVREPEEDHPRQPVDDGPHQGVPEVLLIVMEINGIIVDINGIELMW